MMINTRQASPGSPGYFDHVRPSRGLQTSHIELHE